MNIALIVNSYPPRLGGLEQHVHHLAQGLQERGHHVWVWTISDAPHDRDDDGVQVHTWRAHLPIADVISFPAWGARRRLSRALREHDIDVVSTHTRFFPMSFVGLRAAQRVGIPVIHTEHGSGFVASPSRIVQLGSRLVDMTMGRYVLRHATHVLGVSENATAFIHRLSGVHGEVFYNAIAPHATSGPDSMAHSTATHASDPAQQAHDKTEPASESAPAPVPSRPEHLVFVGRLVEGKGWDTFLDVVALLREQGRNVTGDILGDGADYDEACARCTRMGLDDVVTVRGRVDSARVRDYLRGSTLVNPTVLSEGFQTTLLEAIAEGGQVATFVVPGAQVLRDAGAPVRISADKTSTALAATVEQCLDEPQPCVNDEVLREWTWPARAEQYERIAQRVIASSRRNAP